MVMQLKNRLADEILTDIENIRNNEILYQEKNFNQRMRALDFIEFHIIDRIDAFMGKSDASDQMNLLKQYAEKVRSHLEGVNKRMFHQLRSKISKENYRGKLLLDLINEFLDNRVSTFLQHDAIGYDNLDLFINGLLTDQIMPAETKAREPGMVYYQKTPVRIIFELIKKAKFKPKDVFFDLGSGLGQVAIMVNLFTSAIAKGVEFEPAFCRYAEASAADLHLNHVEFIHADARYADYSSGTLFFMYTPFDGKMLQDVLQNLHGEAKKRKIKIFTYGSCTCEVAQQNWLIKGYNMQTRSGEFGEFISA
jgi:Histone methylation protein DOT1